MEESVSPVGGSWLSTTELVIFSLFGSLIVIITLLVVLLVCRRQYKKRHDVTFRPIDAGLIRKRVVLMHSNMLYASASHSASLESAMSAGGVPSDDAGLGTLRTPLLVPGGHMMMPQVRIEPCCVASLQGRPGTVPGGFGLFGTAAVRGRMSELTSMSEYEIPLDKRWEVPREKYVAPLIPPEYTCLLKLTIYAICQQKYDFVMTVQIPLI